MIDMDHARRLIGAAGDQITITEDQWCEALAGAVDEIEQLRIVCLIGHDRGHYDTCLQALVANLPCNCGWDDREAIRKEIDDGI